MIEKFEVKDFKCHEGLNDFCFPGMTIVSGTNNSGKSSLIQAVYLLTQSRNNPLPVISLNEALQLGAFSDILNRDKGNSETIEFSLWFDRKLIKKDDMSLLSMNLAYVNPSVLERSMRNEGDPVLRSLEIIAELKGLRKHMKLELMDREGSNFYRATGNLEEGFCRIFGIVPEQVMYDEINEGTRRLCSEEFELIRNYIGLIDRQNFKYLKAYRVDDYREWDCLGVNGIGLSGEYTAEVVSRTWDSYIDFKDDLGREYKFSKLFDFWVSKLLGEEYKIRARKIDKNKFKTVVEEKMGNLELPLSAVGFGISQLVPILTLILTSKEQDVILIENPEIHLHPKLQAELVDLFLWALKNNRKLIIETHSEHIINRVRLRVKEENELLTNINIYFFEKKDNLVRYQSIELDSEGKIAYWPNNFFDQSYNDLLGLIKS